MILHYLLTILRGLERIFQILLYKNDKILDDKIKAQYDLDREAAKISASSCGELKKYEHLSGEDLVYKPDVVQKAKFEYSPLGKVFNKGLYESDKKEGLLKRLKNIERENKAVLNTLVKSESNINYKNLSCRVLLSDGKFHEFNFFKKYGTLYDLLENLVTKKTTVQMLIKYLL